MQAATGSINEPLFPERILTHLRPDESLHLGHIVGAVLPCLKSQDLYPGECFFSLSDLCALADGLRLPAGENTVRGLLALGIAPDRCVIYRQSDVPQICELMWILSCITSDPAERRLLHAADVLSMRATTVMAGPNRRRLLERTLKTARRLNSLRPTALVPEPEPAALPSGPWIDTDIDRWLSQRSDNQLPVFADETTLRRHIAAIPDPAAVAFLAILEEPAAAAQADVGLGDGTLTSAALRRRVLSSFLRTFEEARERYIKLAEDKLLVTEILAEGAGRARHEAAETVSEIKDVMKSIPEDLR